MDWRDKLPPAARERLARVGWLSAEEKAAAAEKTELEAALRRFFKGDLTEEDLFGRLKAYENAGKTGLLASARSRLQSSFKASSLRVQFNDQPDGSIGVALGEPKLAGTQSAGEWKVLELTDATFDAAVRDHPLLVVDCWAVWCGPCRMVAPVVEELAGVYEGRIVFGKLNVDRNRATAARFAIQSIPTLLVFKGGRLVDRIVGAMPRAQLEPAVAKHLGGTNADESTHG